MIQTLLLLVLSLLASTVTAQQHNDSGRYIYYKASKQIQFEDDAFGHAKIVNHIFKRGRGVIEFDKEVDTIGAYGFSPLRSLNTIKEISLPYSVTNIGEWAFCNNFRLKSFNIPDNVKTIGDGVVANCLRIKSFHGKFASKDGLALIYNDTLISYAAGNKAKGYTIPNGITTIGGGAFTNSLHLRDIVIPDGVTTIGMQAFMGCENIASIIISRSTTSIGDFAFCDCTSLTNITIPDNVTAIGESAFLHCDNLSEVYCKSKIPPTPMYVYEGYYWGAFDECAPNIKLYVPRESVDAYKTADGWKEYADVIVGYDF